MSYLVFARKYRPGIFDEVVRQEHVTKTLKNAVTAGRVAHAVLFCGPRGTGKTTIARILAKSMNCEKGPTPAPCGVCPSCMDITKGTSVDVHEIDGASNNGVEQIRELREYLKYLPQKSQYKIYIIDEVHMLSVQAFNALLKTLEEPPPHVMFFFATTEPHKIPLTILSRCQRHDLKRIDLESICSHMRTICDREKLIIDDASLELIAKESGGSMRDALSLLDQVAGCSAGEITHNDLVEILGVVDRKVLFDIARAVLDQDITAAVSQVDMIYDRGHNIKEFYKDLVEHFRNLLITGFQEEGQNLIQATRSEIAQMAKQAEMVSKETLIRLLDVLFAEESRIMYAQQPKLTLEFILVKLVRKNPVVPVEILLEKLEGLKSRLAELPLESSSFSIRDKEKESLKVSSANHSHFQAPPLHSFSAEDSGKDTSLPGELSEEAGSEQESARIIPAETEPRQEEEQGENFQPEENEPSFPPLSAQEKPENGVSGKVSFFQKEKEARQKKGQKEDNQEGSTNQIESSRHNPELLQDGEAIKNILFEKLPKTASVIRRSLENAEMEYHNDTNILEIHFSGNAFEKKKLVNGFPRIETIIEAIAGKKPDIRILEKNDPETTKISKTKNSLSIVEAKQTDFTPLVADALEIFEGRVIEFDNLEEV